MAEKSATSTSSVAPEVGATASFARSRDGGPTGSSSRESLAGTVVAGKYLVESVIGAGGMGVVVAAKHLVLGERVAIKFLDAGASPSVVERFRREAQVAIRIKSEHVVHLMDVGTLDTGAPYLVMELLEGCSLAGLLRQKGKLAIDETVDYVLQASEALAEAHALGIVHRDLKPSNLFLTRRADGSPLVKLLDFGIAKLIENTERSVLRRGDTSRHDGEAPEALTGATSVLGSPLYMSPEQVRSSRSVDARADIWSLGVILHELLSGRPPFRADSPSGVLAAIAADKPPRLRSERADVPVALEAVVLRCLAKDPAGRFQDLRALAEALSPFSPERSRVSLARVRGALGDSRPIEPIEVAPAETSPTLEAWTRPEGSSRSVRYAVVVGAIAALGVGGVFWRTSREPAVPAAATEAATPPPAGADVAIERSEISRGSGGRSPPGSIEDTRSVPPAAPTATPTAAATTAVTVATSSPKPAPRRAPPRSPAAATPIPKASAAPPGLDIEAATATRR